MRSRVAICCLLRHCRTHRLERERPGRVGWRHPATAVPELGADGLLDIPQRINAAAEARCGGMRQAAVVIPHDNSGCLLLFDSSSCFAVSAETARVPPPVAARAAGRGSWE